MSFWIVITAAYLVAVVFGAAGDKAETWQASLVFELIQVAISIALAIMISRRMGWMK
jgi:hypothetical protein